MAGVVLVLGAGGIRGWAHVGALEVLHRAGVPVRGLVGASAGSLIAPLYAARRDPDEMLRVALSATPLSLTLWFLDGLRIRREARGFGRLLWGAYGRLNFQELAVPFAAAVLDVATGERLLLREGNVGRAVEASIRPPVLMPPLKLQGRYLTDGGLQDTLPLALARALYPDAPLVGVAVGEFLVLPSGLRPRAAQVALRLRRRNASPSSVLGQVAFMAHLLAQGRPVRDGQHLLVRPRLRGIMSALPFRMREAIEEGRRVARRALPELKRLLAEME